MTLLLDHRQRAKRLVLSPRSAQRVGGGTAGLSAKAQAAWRAQGRYLGAVRRLSKANRANVKAIRERSGIRTAVAAAKKLGKV